MEIEIIVQGERIGWLTTDSPASSYGVPVFRADHDPELYGPTDFGPADKLPLGLPAAVIVKDWAVREGRYSEGLAAAVKFLRQWPDGPQIDVS